jgi:transposase
MTDYPKQMYLQLEEQTEKAERLQGENKALRQENKRLGAELAQVQSQMDTMSATMESRIAASVEQAVNKAVTPLKETIAKQTVEIDRLKGIINRNSGNSSKPPSSNGFTKVANNREPSVRKAGGQPWHKGHTLRIPKNLEELVRAGKVRHEVDETDRPAGAYVSDWEVDWVCTPVYRERRRTPGEPPRVRIGRELQAHCVYLQNQGMMSLERIAEYISEATGGLIKLSEGSIDSFTHKAAANVDVQAYTEDLLNGQVLHTDETPVRTTQRMDDGAATPDTSEHTTFNAYVRVYSNATTTLLTASPHKNDVGVARDGILGRFMGILSHDHDAKLYKYADRHATCGEHLCRELKGMEELGKVAWAGVVRRYFLGMNKRKKKDVAADIPACAPSDLVYYENTYDQLVNQGTELLTCMNEKELGYDELRKMVARLKAYKDSYLRFIRDYTAPFTNNQAERDLRHVKIKQKLSGCYRSWRGLLDYCKIRSLTGTSKKRGLGILLAIRSCFPAPR